MLPHRPHPLTVRRLESHNGDEDKISWSVTKKVDLIIFDLHPLQNSTRTERAFPFGYEGDPGGQSRSNPEVQKSQNLFQAQVTI